MNESKDPVQAKKDFIARWVYSWSPNWDDCLQLICINKDLLKHQQCWTGGFHHHLKQLLVSQNYIKTRNENTLRQKMGRLGTAEEIANLVLYLSSDEVTSSKICYHDHLFICDHHLLLDDHDHNPPVLLHNRHLPCHWRRLEYLKIIVLAITITGASNVKIH